MTKSDDNNAMECRVGLAVAASVEPMPVGLAGGSRDGIDTAQGGEGSLGVEAVMVTPGSNEEGRRPYPTALLDIYRSIRLVFEPPFRGLMKEARTHGGCGSRQPTAKVGMGRWLGLEFLKGR